MSAARTLPFRGTRFGSPGAGSLSLGIPAAAYPGRVATSSDLIVAVDQQQTTLLLPMGVSDLTATVLDPSSIKAFNLLSIDSEIVKTIGPPAGNVVPVSRGFDGTLPAAHGSGAIVAGFIDAYHHNALVAEVEAIETFLGPNGINLPSASSQQGPIPFPPQTPGGNLVVGANVITMTPVPKGVNGTDVSHYLWISGGTGTAEAALITGGSGVAGQPSGQIIITCANAHSGAWTIATATSGVQEAIVAAGAPAHIVMPAGVLPMHGPVFVPIGGYVIEGQGQTNTTLTIDQTYPIGNSAIPGAPFVLQSTGAGTVHRGEFRRFQVNYYQPQSTLYSDYLQYPPTFYGNGAGYVRIDHVNTSCAWLSGDFRNNGSGLSWSDSYISGFNAALLLAGAGDLNVLSYVVVFGGFTSTPVQGTVYSANAIGVQATASFLNAINCICLSKTGWVIDGGGGVAWQQFVNCGFDTSNGLDITNFADVEISNSYFTPGLAADHAIHATDSNVAVTNASFQGNSTTPTSQPLIAVTRGNLILRGCTFNLAGLDTPILSAAGNGSLTFSGNAIGHSIQTYTNSVLSISAGIASIITDNNWSPLLTPSTGTAITFTGAANNGPTIITGNNFLGSAGGNSPWRISGVGTLLNGVISNNPGYNPVGPSAITVGASPFTYAAGPSPETIYITGGTVSLIRRGATTVAAASPAQITLPPFGTVQVTYSAAPTMVKDVQ